MHPPPRVRGSRTGGGVWVSGFEGGGIARPPRTYERERGRASFMSSNFLVFGWPLGGGGSHTLYR
jgi:hypothetical protein